MVKHTQTISLSVFDHFLGLALEKLKASLFVKNISFVPLYSVDIIKIGKQR